MLIVWTRRWHGAFSDDGITGLQKFHTTPVPRIGGLALYAGYWAAAVVAPPAVRGLLLAVGVSAAFAVLVGLFEDLTKAHRVAVRLVGTMLSGVVFCLLSGYAVTRLEIPFLDQVVAVPFFAIAFTAFAVAGIAHAMNIVDGFHGQAVGTGLFLLAAFAMVSLGAGDEEMAGFCLVVAGVFLGFLVVNFPLGRIFLGDGGAYFLGFVLASVAVLVPARNPALSPWVSMIALAYPLQETLFSILRKRRQGTSPFDPDRLHLHMLIYRRVREAFAGRNWDEQWANPVTGLLTWAGGGASLMAVVLVPLGHRDWLLAAWIGLFALYGLLYRAVLPGAERGRVPERESGRKLGKVAGRELG